MACFGTYKRKFQSKVEKIFIFESLGNSDQNRIKCSSLIGEIVFTK